MPESPVFPETPNAASAVEDFIDTEHDDARRYSNRSPLDHSGAYSLHRLAGRIYADGWGTGHITGHDQAHRALRRERDAHRDKMGVSLPIALDLHQYEPPLAETEPGACKCGADLDGDLSDFEAWKAHMTHVLLTLVVP